MLGLPEGALTRAEVLVFVKKCQKKLAIALDQRSAARQVPSLRAAAPAAMARSARRAVAERSALSQVVAIASGSRQASGRRACVRALRTCVLMEKKYFTCLRQCQTAGPQLRPARVRAMAATAAPLTAPAPVPSVSPLAAGAVKVPTKRRKKVRGGCGVKKCARPPAACAQLRPPCRSASRVSDSN